MRNLSVHLQMPMCCHDHYHCCRHAQEPQDIQQELLRVQQQQSVTLQSIASEQRAFGCLARALHRDTQVMAMHCRQVVTAVAALTMAVNLVACALKEGMWSPSDPAAAGGTGQWEGAGARVTDRMGGKQALRGHSKETSKVKQLW